MSAVLNWCGKEHIDCLYLLADPHDTESIRLAEKTGFNLTDIRVTLEATDLKRRFFRTPNQKVIVRGYLPDDLPVLQQYARENHTDSRFFNDPNFSRERAAEMYAVWIEKCCNEFKDTVFVAQYNGEVVGYLSCRTGLKSSGQIVLAGVRTQCRNIGIGTRLVRKALHWFDKEGMKTAAVVTQGTNIRALRLYTSWGFYPVRIALWYHKWFLKG